MLAKRQTALIYGSTGHAHTKSGFKISRLNCLEGESINSYWIFRRWLRFLSWKLSLFIFPVTFHHPRASPVFYARHSCRICTSDIASQRPLMQYNKCHLIKWLSEATSYLKYRTSHAGGWKRENRL